MTLQTPAHLIWIFFSCINQIWSYCTFCINATIKKLAIKISRG